MRTTFSDDEKRRIVAIVRDDGIRLRDAIYFLRSQISNKTEIVSERRLTEILA